MEQPPYGQPVNDQPPLAGPTQDDRRWAMLCHLAALAGLFVPLALNIVGPLVVWLFKREESAFVDDQGKEAINFNITASIVLFLLSWTVFLLVTIPLLAIVAVAWFVLVLIAMLRANSGIAYRYPLTWRVIR